MKLNDNDLKQKIFSKIVDEPQIVCDRPKTIEHMNATQKNEKQACAT